MQNKLRTFLPVTFVFLFVNLFLFAGKNFLENWKVDQDVLFTGNMLLFLITLISFFIAQKGLSHPNPHAFTRAVFSSILLKLAVCIIAAATYIAAFKTHLNKPALFICMGLYLVYTFMEVSVLTKLLKGKEYGKKGSSH